MGRWSTCINFTEIVGTTTLPHPSCGGLADLPSSPVVEVWGLSCVDASTGQHQDGKILYQAVGKLLSIAKTAPRHPAWCILESSLSSHQMWCRDAFDHTVRMASGCNSVVFCQGLWGLSSTVWQLSPLDSSTDDSDVGTTLLPINYTIDRHALDLNTNTLQLASLIWDSNSTHVCTQLFLWRVQEV